MPSRGRHGGAHERVLNVRRPLKVHILCIALRILQLAVAERDTTRRVFVPKSVELATVLLSDLVGSTRLATSVGPARADELRDEFFALLVEAIEASGGAEGSRTWAMG